MSEVVSVRDELDVRTALAGVGTVDQLKVTVVVTSRQGVTVPDLDAARIAAQLGGEVRVVVVPAHLTSVVNRLLGEDLAVRNGAARVYPIRQEGQPYRSMVYLPGNRAAERVVAAARDALRSAHTVPALSGHGASIGAVSAATASPLGLAGGLVDSPALAVELAHLLLNPGRDKPVALVTWPAGASGPRIDAAKVRAEVGGHADVVEMPTGVVSWQFSSALGYPGAECYGGAGRVYPVGTEWTTNLRLSPLRFAYTDSAGPAATDALIADALTASFRSGFAATATTARAQVAGKVTGLVSGRGLVRLTGGTFATIWPELTVAGVTAEQLLTAGMTVHGTVDPDQGRLDVTAALRTADEALASYQPGVVVLGRVLARERALVVVEIFPDVQVAVPAEAAVDDPAAGDLRNWFSDGEVVRARILARGDADGDGWELSLLSVDADPLVAAPALLPGGPAWLQPPPVLEPSPDIEDEPADEVPIVAIETPPTTGADQAAPPIEAEQLAAIVSERDAFARQLEEERKRVARLEGEVSTLRTKNRESRTLIGKQQKQLAGVESALADTEADRAAYLGAEDQFRYEVALAIARRIPAAEKPHLALAEYTLNEQFLGTLVGLEDQVRSKTVDVVVEVLTGRVYDMPGRETHQLRTGPAGSPYLTRPDGATCWRAYLQHKTPQAKRLHFWMRTDGIIELSAVRKHDDFRP